MDIVRVDSESADMATNPKKAEVIAPIFDIPIFVGTESELLNTLEHQIEHGKDLTVLFTPNPEQIALSFHNPRFKQALQASSLNIPDGQGLIWALKRNGYKLRRIAGRELFHSLLQRARQKGWDVFLLGGKAGSGEKIAIDSLKVNPEFKISTSSGALDIRAETPREHEMVLERIKLAKPKLLFVAFGAPWQELWVIKNREALQQLGVRLVMVVGGALDYEAGVAARVPEVMARLNLEWFWRLIKEPWRWKRQLKGLEFFWRTLLA